ncbi:MAG TPA: xylulokinase [Candidatus Limnocylindrales bacterium]|nr:xylulokinase [Candidatus Limnocylindrales bacterium]
MHTSLVAGVDCSTQATKVALVDAETGRIVGIGRASHVVAGDGGARESDPRGWWTALERALAAAVAAGGDRRDIVAISVAGQQHGLVVLDARGDPLRDAPLWNDTRSAPDAERLTAELGAETWADRTGLRPVASFTVTKWAWLRRTQPSLAAAVAAVRLPHDYLTERLTGIGVTDRGDVSGTGWWSTRDEQYDARILGLPGVELPVRLLPEVLGPVDRAGTVSPGVAAALGLRPDVVVGPGTGDNMGAALGLGLAVGQPALSLGTSGTAFAVSAVRPTDPSGTVAGFCDASGRFLPLAATLNCTLAVERVATWLGIDREDVEPAREVVVLPYLDGERTPDLPTAAGRISGLRHATSRQEILMATYEGAALSLLDALDAIAVQAAGLASDRPLVLVGGGARGRAWREVVRRLSGRAVLVPDADELVALGAAVQAAAVRWGEQPGAVAARWRTSRGTLLDPLPRDDDRLGRIRAARDAVVREAQRDAAIG